MNVAHLTLKFAAIAGLGAAVLLFTWAATSNPQSLVHRYWRIYVNHLSIKLRNLLVLDVAGATIAKAQCAAALAVVLTATYTGYPEVYVALVVVAFAPVVELERRRVSRLKAIEAKMDGFILTLANALKSTPSIGRALSYTQPLLASPLDEEVGLALKEIRVGSTIDQALLNMSGRIRSTPLDAALTGVLIGRQVGGDLTKILQTTAETLREIARLQGLVRAKTAEGKGQLTVLAIFPAAILVLFDTVSPGYFEPLARSPVGYLITAGAIILWIGAVAIARKVLAVDI